MDIEPLYTEKIFWKGSEHELRFFPTTTPPQDVAYTQCQAVPFTKDGDVVMFKHLHGYNSLPGGTVELGESYDEALKREVYEESACKVLSCGVFGYFLDTNLETGVIQHQLRYWAIVETLDEPVEDPDGKALERLVVPFADAPEVLGWGDKGTVLINLAKAAVK